MKNSCFSFGSLLGGMIIGSALALLFAPRSGEETRRSLKNLVDKQVDKVREKYHEAKAEMN